MIFKFLFLLSASSLVFGNELEPLVQSPSGQIKGYFMKTRGGREIAAYTSIPFAVPPIDELRFKAPVPVEPWDHILDATSPSPKCIQRNPYVRQKDIVGVEDCLYLNIYSPITPNTTTKVKKLPVMVWFHGGGWMCGDSSTKTYSPQYLLDRDIVLVATNYRLGPLGFLSTQDEHCPGNNGLKDQQEALRWIQNNIHSFGGDKTSVTIFGESAGGASVNFHMVSPTSAGLFHKAISQSGTALVPWAESPIGEAPIRALQLAKLLGCPHIPSESLLKCLRTKDSYDIINTEFDFYMWDYEPMTPFKAVIEPDLPGAFLTKPVRPNTNLHSVPWLTGLTKDEGCLKTVWITNNETRYSEFSKNFDTLAPVTFYYDNSEDVDFVTKSIRKFYLNGRVGPLTDKDKNDLVEIYTDSYFAYPAYEAVNLAFEHSKAPIYLYQLNYRATNSFSQVFGDPNGDHGVCHADDLMHLFPIHFLKKTISEDDLEISELILNLWTNFATSGNPNKPIQIPIKWEPITGDKMEYLTIDTKLKMSKNLAKRSVFWRKMPLWYNNNNLTQRFVDEL